MPPCLVILDLIMKLVYIMGDRQDHTLGSHIVYVTDWGNKNSFWHRAWRMAGILVFAMESDSEDL